MRGKGGLMEDVGKSIQRRAMKLFLKRNQTIPENLLMYLTPRERGVIENNLFEKKSFREIGQSLGISGESARQIGERAFLRLFKIQKEKSR
ncbi:MAG TPA: hypothetical protein DCY12_12080 [Candidatus Atribacteria bacterium]|nr:hypothetical protein [Candidatus Atribacteria bacterium]